MYLSNNVIQNCFLSFLKSVRELSSFRDVVVFTPESVCSPFSGCPERCVDKRRDFETTGGLCKKAGIILKGSQTYSRDKIICDLWSRVQSRNPGNRYHHEHQR